MPPELGNIATGDCDTLPATFTYVPNALPVTLCACTAPARRVSAKRILEVMVVLLERLVVAGQAVLLDVAARQKSVTRVHVADRDLDVIIANAWFSDIARVIHLERHILEGAAVARIQPAHAAETPTAIIARGFVHRGREERHLTMEGEAAAKLVRVVLVPLDVAAAVGRRARTAGASLETERRKVVGFRRAFRKAVVVACIDAATAGQPETGARSLFFFPPRRDVARRARGLLTRDRQ